MQHPVDGHYQRVIAACHAPAFPTAKAEQAEHEPDYDPAEQVEQAQAAATAAAAITAIAAATATSARTAGLIDECSCAAVRDAPRPSRDSTVLITPKPPPWR